MQLSRILALLWLLTVVCEGKPPSYAGGDGSTMEKAIIVKADDEQAGVQAEYDYLKKHFPGYKQGGQALQSAHGKNYDLLDFTTAKGEKLKLYFDISAFFGK